MLLKPAGIIAEEVVEPMPAVLKALCRRLVRWRILPPDREPDTAIVNVYDTGASRGFANRSVHVVDDASRGHCSLQRTTSSVSWLHWPAANSVSWLGPAMAPPPAPALHLVLSFRMQGTASRRTSITTTLCALSSRSACRASKRSCSLSVSSPWTRGCSAAASRCRCRQVGSMPQQFTGSINRQHRKCGRCSTKCQLSGPAYHGKHIDEACWAHWKAIRSHCCTSVHLRAGCLTDGRVTWQWLKQQECTAA